MKSFTNNDVDFIFDYLIDNLYFTEDELILITKVFGDNIDNYNAICQCRYGYDFQQLIENDFFTNIERK